MKIKVHVAQEAQGRHRAWCPMLPGCWAVLGDNSEQALAAMRQAVEEYVASLDAVGPLELDVQTLDSGRCCEGPLVHSRSNVWA